MIIARQRGLKYHLGKGVKRGSDDTVYAMKEGVVQFRTKKQPAFTGAMRTITVIDVIGKS